MSFSFYKFLFKFYISGIAVLFFLRVLFQFSYSFSVSQYTFENLFVCYSIGFIIDSSVVSVSILCCLLLSFIIGYISKNFYLVFFRLSFIIISIIFLINIIDIFYFGQFGVRLNQYALQEFQSPKTILPMIYHEYHTILILISLFILLFLFFVLCRKYTFQTLKTIGDTCLMDYTCVQRGIIRHPFLMANKREYAFAFKKAEKELKETLKK